MQMTFEVRVEAEDATPDEMEEAIQDCLRVLEMPNGDTLYIDFPSVSFVPDNARDNPAAQRSC